MPRSASRSTLGWVAPVNTRSEPAISVPRSGRLSSIVRAIHKWVSQMHVTTNSSFGNPQLRSGGEEITGSETIYVTAVVPQGRDCGLLKRIAAQKRWDFSMAHDWAAGFRLIVSRKGGVVLSIAV